MPGVSDSKLHTIPTLFHSTHYNEMLKICQRRGATYKGNPKQWRSYSTNGASYVINVDDSNTRKWIRPDDSEWLPGPLLWFATMRPGKFDNIYGPCVFEHGFVAVIESYQECRRISREEICYRVGGTLVYQQEVSHVVVVCSSSDDHYKKFPEIQGSNTKYFTPPNDKELPSMMINQYSKRLDQNMRDCTRHDHVTVAFYLPYGTQLTIPNHPHISNLQILPHYYCMKSRLNGGKCGYEVDNETMEKAISIKWDQ